MRIADRLGRSVSEAKSSITSTEFIRWAVYLEKEVNGFHRQDYFLAQIAHELYLQRCLWTETKPTRTINDYMVKFESAKAAKEKEEAEAKRIPDPQEEITREEARKAHIEASKSVWLGAVMGGKRPLPKPDKE